MWPLLYGVELNKHILLQTNTETGELQNKVKSSYVSMPHDMHKKSNDKNKNKVGYFVCYLTCVQVFTEWEA